MPTEHREIIEALVSGDSELARKVAYNHVKRLKDFVIKEGPAFATYK
jgi:DNA-binding GntR family transcriptional regulator